MTERVYVITRYWDNDEDYPEDFSHHTEIFRVYKSIDNVEKFFTNGITSHQILGNEYDRFDITSVKHEGKEDHYYETRNIIFEAHEMDLCS